MVRNRMSATQLVAQKGCSLDFIRNEKTGKIFFVCGDISGRITRAVLDRIYSNSLSLNDFEYCERVVGNTTIPEIGLKSNNVIMRFM